MSATPRLNRRQALMGAVGAAAIVGGAGAYAVVSLDRDDLARAVLERLVGPFDMAPDQFSAFVAAFNRKHPFPGGVKNEAWITAERTGAVDALLRQAPESFWYREFRRRLLTDFVIKTGFVQANGGPLTYVDDDQPCASPFARFDEA